MTGLALNYRIDLEQPQRVLTALQQADTRPLMDEIGDYLLNETLFRFELEQTPEGESWTPSQRAANDGGKTLQDRGHLRDSYTYAVAISGESVEVGSNMIYAAIHHAGGQAGRNLAVEIVPRPALGLNDQNQDDIGEMVLDYYRGLVNEH